MAKQIFLADDKDAAVPYVGDYVIQWCLNHPECGLGGATGRSPIDVWRWIWSQLAHRAEAREAVTQQNVLFLDEYFGAFSSYYHWAYRNLRVDQGGFESHRVFTPRGCVFESNRIVNSQRLNELLTDWPEDWTPQTEPGEDGEPPEVRIHQTASHPVLAEIRDSMADYDRLVRDHGRRLQLLGLGVGGAIERDPRAGGHIGFVEYGAAAGDSQTMLVRLAGSTSEANRSDFQLRNDDGDVGLESARFAVTQGVSTILSAGELLLMAWGPSKTKAVERMLLGDPCPQNPAAWVQSHPNVTMFLDRAAIGDLHLERLVDRGWSVEPAGARTTG